MTKTVAYHWHLRKIMNEHGMNATTELVPLLADRISLLVAVVSGLGAWLISRFLPGGLVILLAGVGGALLGAALVTRYGRGDTA